jgi:NAD(P)-dependent dehydrogenase (short-subunit alcohol dehydrogenase family)
MNFRLDKRAIVTGGSRGIGKAIALELARRGCHVAVCSRGERSPEDLPGSLDETISLITAMGGKATAITADVTSDADIERMFHQANLAMGGVDIVVNNAALVGINEPFIGGNSESFDRMLRVNLRAPYVIAQRAALQMRDNGGGTIVNISSHAARHPFERADRFAERSRTRSAEPLYGMSKAALDRFGSGVAAELERENIAIVTIVPGFTLTERIAKILGPNADTSMTDSPEVTARAVAFVCCDAMPLTGRVLIAQEIVEANAR